MKWYLLIGAAIAAYFIYKQNQNSTQDGTDSNTIPQPVTPVVTGSDCVGSVDALGHWRGVDTSGNCTPFALGGSGGDF